MKIINYLVIFTEISGEICNMKSDKRIRYHIFFEITLMMF